LWKLMIYWGYMCFLYFVFVCHVAFAKIAYSNSSCFAVVLNTQLQWFPTFFVLGPLLVCWRAWGGTA